MRIDLNRKSMDMERRDINYILPSYIRMYLFQARNEDPEVITFPMFKEVPHPNKPGVMIPVNYVPELSDIAVEIAEDGAYIAETTPESEAEADMLEEQYRQTVEQIDAVQAEIKEITEADVQELSPAQKMLQEQESSFDALYTDEEVNNMMIMGDEVDEEYEVAKADIGIATPATIDPPTPERLAQAKMPPGGALPPGTPSDYGGRREAGLQKLIANDLKPEREVNEAEEVETDIPKES